MAEKYDLLLYKVGNITIYRCNSLETEEFSASDMLRARGIKVGPFTRVDCAISILLSEGWEPFSINVAQTSFNPAMIAFRRLVQ